MTRGILTCAALLAATGCAGVGVDWTTDLATARERTGLSDFGPDDFREGLQVIVDGINAEAQIRDSAWPHLRERFLRQGVELRASASPEENTAFIRAEADKYAKIARDAGLKPE